MRSELAFELLNRIGPLEGLGGLIVVNDEVEHGLLKLIKAGKMVRLQEFALEQAQPDFDLVQPGGIGRQPIELYRQFFIRPRRQFLNKAGELLGSVGRTIIEDQRNCLRPTMVGFGNDDRL